MTFSSNFYANVYAVQVPRLLDVVDFFFYFVSLLFPAISFSFCRNLRFVIEKQNTISSYTINFYLQKCSSFFLLLIFIYVFFSSFFVLQICAIQLKRIISDLYIFRWISIIQLLSIWMSSLVFWCAVCLCLFFCFFFQFSFTWLVFLCSFVYFAILLYLSTIYILYHTHSLYVWVSFILTRLQINFLRDWMEAYNNNNWISFFVMMKRNYVIYLE